MASPSQLRQALIKLLGTSDDIPTGGGKLPIPENQVGPGPTPFDSLEDMEAMGLSQRNQQNQFQKALIEDSADKKIVDPYDKSSVFDETPDRPQQLEREVMEEATGPHNRVHTKSRSTMDEMDNLFGEEEAKQVEAIKKQLNEQGIKRSRVPTERDRAEVLNVARDEVKLKEVDQMAKRVFDKIEDLERTLVMPEGTSQADIASSGIAESNKRLKNFKREAAQAAARARKSGDNSELIAIEDRLTASPKNSAPFERTAEDSMIGHNSRQGTTMTLKSPVMEELNKRLTITPAGSGKKVESTNESSFNAQEARIREGANPPGVEYKQDAESVLKNALIEIMNARGK